MAKGKTYRRRRSKIKCSKNIPMDHNSEIITLTKWIKRNGFLINKKMKIADCTNTGRGIMALERINAGDVLMEVPFAMIFNIISLELDIVFKGIFNMEKIDFKFRCQELLAFYLSYLKISNSSLFWKNYIDSLPNILTVPYFTDISNIKNLDNKIFEIVNNQKIIVNESFEKFKNVLAISQQINSQLSNFKNHFTLSLYEWSYFIINSRCVYLDPDVIKSLYGTFNKHDNLLNLLFDEPNLGLIPYLDMFNHACEAKTSSELSSSNHNDKTINNNVTFKLISLNECRKYDQIFISYGNHCNLKLLTEYGFCLPNNPLTKVTFLFNDISNLDLSTFKICAEKYKYIHKHKLNEDIYVCLNGYSYNFLRLLFIITCHDKRLWNSKIYSNDFSEIEYVKIYNIGILLLIEKFNYLCKILNQFKLKSMDDYILNNAISLVDEYTSILSFWIDKHSKSTNEI